jgi:endonuclease-3 related protein
MDIFELYKFLKKKYRPLHDQWKLWCKRPKSMKDREEVIIGTILTQNTNWRNVERAVENLKRSGACSIEGIHRMPLRTLEQLIRPSGFYHDKARYLKSLAGFVLARGLKKLMESDANKLRRDLLELPGVGKETADSILLYALDKPIFVIDNYTRRFVKKYRLSDEKSYDKLQAFFEGALRRNFKTFQDFHALIIIDGKTERSSQAS